MITEHAIVSIWLTLPGDSLTSQVPPRHIVKPMRSHATIPANAEASSPGVRISASWMNECRGSWGIVRRERFSRE